MGNQCSSDKLTGAIGNPAEMVEKAKAEVGEAKTEALAKAEAEAEKQKQNLEDKAKELHRAIVSQLQQECW